MRTTFAACVVLCLVLAGSTVFAASVETAQLCTSIVDRQCEGAGDSFPSTVGKVYAYTRILDLEGSVIHRWIYKDQVMAEVTLEVGGSPWRTWSSKSIDPLWSGQWKVEVVNNNDGSVMDIMEFAIIE